MAINASPDLARSDEIHRVLASCDASRVAVELTGYFLGRPGPVEALGALSA